MCYSIFEGLTIEELARLAIEKSLHKIIGQVVSTDEQQFDGSIPEGGVTQKPFLHLYRNMSSDDAQTVRCENPRKPDEIPRGFPVITGSDALITAIEDVIQTYVHTWDPKTSSVCPPQTAERPYKLV